MIRVPVPVIVEMTDEQQEAYVREYNLPRNGPGGRVLAKDVVASVRANVEHGLTDSALPKFATVSLKDR